MTKKLLIWGFLTAAICLSVLSPTKTTASTLPQPEFGFTTHLYIANNPLNLTLFRQNVDDLVAGGQTWIRVNIWDWEIAAEGNPRTTIIWNTNNLAIYDQAFNYALEKGLKIFLVTNTPIYSDILNFSPSEYHTLTANYHQFLSQRYAGKINVWQIFNEADTHDYHNYFALSGLTSNYLNELNQVVGIARSAIKQNDPQANVTMNSTGYPLTDQIQNRWFQFFDVLNTNLDFLTLDLYPDVNRVDSEMAIMGQRVINVRNRYNKPVAVGETGLCTRTSLFTEEDQAHYLPLYVENLKIAQPNLILVYEIQDENNLPNDCEGSFGLKRVDGTKKPSYEVVLAAMSTTTICPWDLVKTGISNGKVDGLDLAELNRCYAPLGGIAEGCQAADLNSNGVVNALDYSILLTHWGTCPAN